MLKQAIYLVPYDFTNVTESAFRLALEFAEKDNGIAYLLHIAKNNNEKKKAKKSFEELISTLSSTDRERTYTKIIVGDLFEDMGKAGDILNATMIIMGTHGAHGLQKVFGSNAVKMISYANVPFLIIQEGKVMEKIKNIVMPFSFAKESIQITTFVSALAKKFNARIHLVGFHDKDEWLGGHTKANQIIVRKALIENGVEHEIINLPREQSYEFELLEYASEVDADLIAAAYFKEGIMPTPNSFIQQMIDNKHMIPLMSVNAEELFTINSNLSFMTV